MMEPRILTTADREAQILALWRGRPPDRRMIDDVPLFHAWVVDYAPWLLPPGAAAIDDIRSIVEADTVTPEELEASATGRRRRSSKAAVSRGHG